MATLFAVDLRPTGVNAMQAVPARAWPSDTTFKSKAKLKEQRAFDAQVFLHLASREWKVVEYRSKVAVFMQGDPATSVLYIQRGGLKLTVVNDVGKEAVVAILGPGNFIGEGCLAGQLQRVSTAETITRSTILVIERPEMIRLLHSEPALSERFIRHMLSRNIRAEQDLIDQLFNSSEKRLARTLLLLARYGEKDKSEKMVTELSQEMLAEMVGTTRSRVNFFMNKFRKLGFIEYDHEIRINSSLLSVVPHE